MGLYSIIFLIVRLSLPTKFVQQIEVGYNVLIVLTVLLDTKVKGALPERKGKNGRKKREGQLFHAFYPLFV